MSLWNGAPLAEVYRGDLLESVHIGHAVVASSNGIEGVWGDAETVIFPRSSMKMLQALPLVESGVSLSTEQMALACASHNGAPVHVSHVEAWLTDLGLDANALRCGPQPSGDKDRRAAMARAGEVPTRMHNNCSGKHTGFLMLEQRLGGGAEYVAVDHPVQRAVRDAIEEMAGMQSPGYGIDGCSAPNFALTIGALARAMARFATARPDGDARQRAAVALRDAMMRHPVLVAGEGRACTRIMAASPGAFAVKTGAEGVFVAILPERGLGIAVKAADGATRAAEAAIVALLVRFGALDARNPIAAEFADKPIRNWDGLVTGAVRPAPELLC